jgi:hypothetical protein
MDGLDGGRNWTLHTTVVRDCLAERLISEMRYCLPAGRDVGVFDLELCDLLVEEKVSPWLLEGLSDLSQWEDDN